MDNRVRLAALLAYMIQNMPDCQFRSGLIAAKALILHATDDEIAMAERWLRDNGRCV